MSSTFPEPHGASRRTRIIAHRGASGYLPEHTLAAKVLAYGLGVDFLEQDIVAARDGTLVVLHDIHLDEVSDVAQQFPGRTRDGRHYAIDFDYDELARLKLGERRQPGGTALLYPGRFPGSLDAFRILSLGEEIRLTAGLNRVTGRPVGIYPEIKQPAWHAAAGIDLTRLVHEALARAGDEAFDGPVMVQCFDPAALRRLRDELGSPWPLVQLLDAAEAESLQSDPSARRTIARYADAVGLPYGALIAAADGKPASTGLAERLAESGLAVHPYTLRRDVAPASGLDYADVLRFLIHELAVDAVFCDHPDDAIAIRDGRSPSPLLRTGSAV